MNRTQSKVLPHIVFCMHKNSCNSCNATYASTLHCVKFYAMHMQCMQEACIKFYSSILVMMLALHQAGNCSSDMVPWAGMILSP